MANPYDILGVAPHDPLDAAEEAYHRLVRRLHPDLHHAEGPDAVRRAEQATLALNDAIAAVRLDHRHRARSAAGGDTAAGTQRADRDTSGAHGATGSAGTTGRSHTRERTTAGPANPSGDAGAEHAGAAAWVNDRPTGTACPFCGIHVDDLATYDHHLQNVHGFRVFTERRSSWFTLRVSRGVRDVLAVLAMALGGVAFFALTRYTSISPLWWFAIWFGVVVAALRSTFGLWGGRR